MEKKYSLLIVDDEKDIVDQLYDYFRRDYSVHKAYDCNEALNILKDNEVHLVMTDQRMPNMQGTELLAKLKEDKPEITRILMTGYTDLEVAVKAINEGSIHRYLSKPLDFDQLQKIIKEGIEFHLDASKVKNLITQEKEDIIGKVKDVLSKFKAVEVDKGKLEGELQAAKEVENRIQKEMEEKITQLEKEREAAVGEIGDIKDKMGKAMERLDAAEKEAEKAKEYQEVNLKIEAEKKDIESKFLLANKSAMGLKAEIGSIKQERDTALAEKNRIDKKLKQFQKNWKAVSG